MSIRACQRNTWRCLLVAAWLACPARAADAPRWEPLMYSDPELERPPVVSCYSDRLVPLWQAALRRPENETRRLAAQSIIRARQFRLPGLQQAAPDLRAALQAEGSRAARMAVARALTVIDDRQAAPQLAVAADADPLLAEVVEPALAAWNYEPRRPVWVRQLADGALSWRRRQLAAEACGVARVAAAAAVLEEVIADRGEVSAIRLAAAQALPHCAMEDPLDLAQRLAQSPFILDQLLAASVLSHARHDDSADLLHRLARHANSAVAAPAYAALAAAWHDRALTLAPEVIVRQSARLRKLGAEVYARQGGSQAVTALGSLLPDPAPSVRQFARSELARLAVDELRPEVEAQLTAALAGDPWQGHEQGAVLAVELKHLAANERLAQLLEAEHPVSSLAAAWALGHQAGAELMPQLLERAKALHQSDRSDDRRKRELMQLCQALGRNQHHPADPLLRQIIPKDTFFPTELRMAAVWALGKIHAGEAPQDVSDLLAARLNDTAGLMPEISGVRSMAAIALARTNSQSHLDTLRRFVNEPDYELREGVRWALTELTGEQFPPPRKHLRHIHGWFLEPTKPGRLLEAED